MAFSIRALHRLIILFVIYNTVQSFSYFSCTDKVCTCGADKGCEHRCKTAECIDYSFFCTSSSSLCLVNCIGAESCRDSQVYAAANNVILNCNGTDACIDTQIFCGIPPASGTNILWDSNDQFSGPMTECFINLMTPNAMANAEMTCSGSISNCIVNAVTDNSVAQSTFDWYDGIC